MPKRSPKTNRRSKAFPALLGFGVSVSMVTSTSFKRRSVEYQPHGVTCTEFPGGIDLKSA